MKPFSIREWCKEIDERAKAQQLVILEHSKQRMFPAMFWECIAFIALMIALLSWATWGHAAGVAQNVTIGADVSFGLQSVYPQNLFSYTEPSTTTAQFSGSTVVNIPASSTNNEINTATLFPAFATPVAIGLQDITDGGVAVDVGTSTDDTRIHMAANGFILYRTASGTPTFYVDNTGDTDAQIQVFGLSN